MRDLAGAREEEVLSVWAGLGYYSRAGRVLKAARGLCASAEEYDGGEPRRGDGGGGPGAECGEGGDGLLPGTVEGLMRVPGIGRYTAGAVAAIVFGVAAPMVDGNVLRVLSRQMGVFGDVKGDKAVVGLLWDAAERLVESVARDGDDGENGDNGGADEVSDRPGRWGQALMELGSTVCTPKPNCAACPITQTCRVYAEGLALAGEKSDVNTMHDIEDPCALCAPLEEALDHGVDGTVKAPKTEPNEEGRLSRFFATTKPARAMTTTPQTLDSRTLATITHHAKKFPLKKPKKAVRKEEAVVCAIRRSSDGRYLIHRRPETGLLAGLWELPSYTLPASNNSTAKGRKTKAASYVTGMVARNAKDRSVLRSPIKHVGELGSVPWLFSHLRLTMHVHLFELVDVGNLSDLDAQRRWAHVEDIDKESMGTGMKKCWSIVKES